MFVAAIAKQTAAQMDVVIDSVGKTSLDAFLPFANTWYVLLSISGKMVALGERVAITNSVTGYSLHY